MIGLCNSGEAAHKPISDKTVQATKWLMLLGLVKYLVM
jgi:hypothetical protein